MAVNNILSGDFKSTAPAMRDAGYSKRSSLNSRHTLFNRRGVQVYIESLFEIARRRWGMSLPEKVMLVYLDGLEATKRIGRKAVEFPDWVTRKAYLDTLAGFLGWIK